MRMATNFKLTINPMTLKLKKDNIIDNRFAG